MPREARGHEPEAVVHIISRGVDKREIFTADEDRRFFLELLKSAFGQHGVSLFAYCLMGNHFHLLVCAATVPLGVPLHQALTRYAQYYNGRYGRSGHLFEDRFKSIVCLDLAYLIQLVAYIHLNPVRAGLCGSPGDWRWSSHREFVSGTTEFTDYSRLSDVCGMTADELRARYHERIERARDSRPGARIPLDSLLKQAAAFVGIKVGEMGDPSRGEAQTKAKRLLIAWAADEGYSNAAMARALGCTRSAISQLKRPNVKLGASPPA